MAPGGYAWWYADALSDAQADGSALALVLIAFVGSVFSPYYAAARRRHGDAHAPAEQHNAINLSLYRRAPGQAQYRRLWCMTERGAAALSRSHERLQIGRSRLQWRGGGLQIDIDEWAVPWPQRLRGRIELWPQALPGRDFALDAQGHHRWQPIAPLARVQVDLQQPRQAWQGSAYLDHNRGSRPLARDFSRWQWARGQAAGATAGGTAGLARIAYVAQPRLQGLPLPALHLQLDNQGQLHALPAPLLQPLPASGWGLDRQSLELAGPPGSTQPPRVATLESGPFYVRSLLQHRDGSALVHESLSLDRFDRRWVQSLLPFRMPRRG